MITAGMIWDKVASDLHEETQDDREKIKANCALAYYELISKCAWESLRREVYLDFANADPITHAMLMPANMVNVEAVFETAPGATQYFGREYLPGSRFGNAHRPTYAFTRPVTTPLAVLQNVSVVSLSNTWGGGTWDASYVNEYIRFGDNQGLYKITAPNTFEPIFFGDIIEGDVAFIRPVGTRNMILKDESGNLIAPKVTVYFWVYPPPLTTDEQDILLPSSRPLELMIYLRMVRKDRRSQTDIDDLKMDLREAIDSMVASNPKFISPKPPTNAHGGSIFGLNRLGGGFNSYRQWRP